MRTEKEYEKRTMIEHKISGHGGQFISCQETTNVSIDNILAAEETDHAAYERSERMGLAIKLNGVSKAVATFLVDRGHKDGKELHVLTQNGIIFILNEQKYKKGVPSLVTALIARPGQVSRYFTDEGKKAPKQMLAAAKAHEEQGFNNR